MDEIEVAVYTLLLEAQNLLSFKLLFEASFFYKSALLESKLQRNAFSLSALKNFD